MLQSGWGVNRKGAKLCAPESLGVEPASLQPPSPPAAADFLHAGAALWALREAAAKAGCLCCWSLMLWPPPSADMPWCSSSQHYQDVCALSISSQAHPCIRGGARWSPTAPTSGWKRPFVPHEALHLLFHSCAARALLAWRSTLRSALKSNYEACYENWWMKQGGGEWSGAFEAWEDVSVNQGRAEPPVAGLSRPAQRGAQGCYWSCSDASPSLPAPRSTVLDRGFKRGGGEPFFFFSSFFSFLSNGPQTACGTAVTVLPKTV